jgi:hypothetical protein
MRTHSGTRAPQGGAAGVAGLVQCFCIPLRPNFNIRPMLGRKSVDALENDWVRSESFGRHNKFGIEIPSVIFDYPNQTDPSEAVDCIECFLVEAIPAITHHGNVLVMSGHGLDPFQGFGSFRGPKLYFNDVDLPGSRTVNRQQVNAVAGIRPGCLEENLGYDQPLHQ